MAGYSSPSTIALLNDYAWVVALAAGLLTLVTLAFLLIIMARVRRLAARYRALLKGPQDQDMAGYLNAQVQAIEELRGEVALTQDRLAHHDAQLLITVQKIGLVRFNAFPDLGSELSFALAVLDGHNDGYVLTSLFGRDQSRVYAKPIKAGTSTYQLSGEEREAIAKAMSASAPATSVTSSNKAKKS